MNERISFSELLKIADERDRKRRLDRGLKISKDEIRFTESEAELLLKLIQEYRIANTQHLSQKQMVDRYNFIEEIERKLTVLSQ